ncbi:MAG: hypothetical protein ACI9ZF_002963, partial [Bradyrhizobium sp.]
DPHAVDHKHVYFLPTHPTPIYRSFRQCLLNVF